MNHSEDTISKKNLTLEEEILQRIGQKAKILADKKRRPLHHELDSLERRITDEIAGVASREQLGIPRENVDLCPGLSGAERQDWFWWNYDYEKVLKEQLDSSHPMPSEGYIALVRKLYKQGSIDPETFELLDSNAVQESLKKVWEQDDLLDEPVNPIAHTRTTPRTRAETRAP